jgi:hypothetical protein
VRIALTLSLAAALASAGLALVTKSREPAVSAGTGPAVRADVAAGTGTAVAAGADPAAGSASAAGLAARTTDPPATEPAIFRLSDDIVASGPRQNFEYYPYDARLTFVRIMPKDGRSRRFGGFRGSREPPWAHDYPTAEHNLSKIVRELTFVRVRVEDWGGNILTLDDPRLMQFPLAYMSEPGFWSVTPEEADALREYLLKGGFVIFDDFGGNRSGEMYNLAEQMAIVLPELEWVRLDLTDEIFDSFFQIDPDNLQLAANSASYRGVPVFYGLFENNDRQNGRLMAIAGDGGDFGEFWEFSDRGYYPVDISNEAYKVGINYLVYALTH